MTVKKCRHPTQEILDPPLQRLCMTTNATATIYRLVVTDPPRPHFAWTHIELENRTDTERKTDRHREKNGQIQREKQTDTGRKTDRYREKIGLIQRKTDRYREINGQIYT